MSKLTKVSIAFGSTVVFLLVTLSIFVKVMVTPERIRGNLLPLLEEALQRKVEIGRIDIGFLTGVSLSNLQIYRRSASGVFISVESISLHYKFSALLTGDLVIDQVLLEAPMIVVIRKPDGKFNFSDLLTDTQEKPVADDVDTEKDKLNSPSVSALNLLINKLSIRGGKLLYIDRSLNSKSPYRYALNQLDFQAEQIVLDRPFPIELQAELSGSKIAISGNYDISKQSGDLDIQLVTLDLMQFAPYFRQALPGKLGSAELALNLEVQFQSQQIDSKGNVQLGKLDLVLNDYPDAAVKQASLGVDYALSYDISQQRLDMSTFFVDFNDTVISVEGSVDLAASEPLLDLAILFDKLDLRNLLKGVPDGLTKSLQPYSLAGQVNGRIELLGAPSTGAKLVKSANIKLIDVQATLDALRAGADGEIIYADQQVKADELLLKVADQQVSLSFNATDLFGDTIKGEFSLAADQLDLNSVLPEKAERKTDTRLPSMEREPTVADEIGPFDIPVAMVGTLSVDKLIYKQLALDQVHADLVLQDNHFKINQLRSGIAGGELLASADIDLGVKGLKYHGQMKLDQSQLVSLVSGLVPQAEQSISGLLQWQNNFSGQGTIPDRLLKTLQVKGAMLLQQGEITGSPLLEQLALFLGLPDLEILSFDLLETRYDLRNGLANLSGQFDSSKAKLKPQGTVGVDGALNMKLDARIAPELMQNMGVKIALQEAVSDKDGWGILPLLIRGSVNSPKISFDAQALQQQAVRQVKEKATKSLLDKIAPNGGAEQQPVRQLLEGTLNRLFGN